MLASTDLGPVKTKGARERGEKDNGDNRRETDVTVDSLLCRKRDAALHNGQRFIYTASLHCFGKGEKRERERKGESRRQ